VKAVAGPRVSIIVPVFNGANYMREAIDSALAQTHPDTEVVVINDGSRDGGETDRIARAYGPRIRYLAKENGGVATALNAGIAAMTGEVFCWCSHDDLHIPDKTARQVAEWERLGRPDAVLFCDYRLSDAGGAPLEDVRLDHAMLAAKPAYAVLRGAVHGCSVFVPRRLFDTCGLFDPALPTTQDYDLWFRMARRVPFLHMADVLVLSRWHEAQGSKQGNHTAEAEALWAGFAERLPEEEMAALEGSPLRFLRALAAFTRGSGLAGAAARIDALAEAGLRDTLVSVVIPVHDEPLLAASAVESAAAQTHASLEILVVDDGSTADMRALGEAVARHAPRARLLRQDNAGPGAARNRGLAEAHGRYVAFLDADDLWQPDKVARQLRAMEEAGAAFGFTSYVRLDTATGRLSHIAEAARNAFPDAIGACNIATPTVMLRRDVLDAGFRFREDIRQGEDVVLWLSLLARLPFLGLAEPLTVVRAGADAAASDPERQRRGLGQILAAAEADPLLAAHPAQLERLRAALAAA